MRDTKFEQWALVELMGHQRIAGLVSETTIAGQAIPRVDVPDQTGAILAERERFNRVLERAAIYVDGQRGLCDKLECDDERLVHIAQLLSGIADNALLSVHGIREQRDEAASQLIHYLSGLLVFCSAWLGLEEFIELIFRERVRQRTLFLARKLPFDCASTITDPRRKFRVLLEEAGEVARAVDHVEQRDTEQNRFEQRVEIAQLAAVAAAWLEAL